MSARLTRKNYASVDIAAESVTPLYDNLLVKRIYEEQTGAIIAPGVEKTQDGRWVKKTDEGPYKGIVVAAGKGDKRKPMPGEEPCPICGRQMGWHVEPGACLTSIGLPSLSAGRVPMSVGVGDTIIYPRFESTHVLIQEQKYTFVREGDVMAVIEEDSPSVSFYAGETTCEVKL